MGTRGGFSIPLLILALGTVLLGGCGQSDQPPPAPDSSEATKYTLAGNNSYAKKLDLANQQDFDDAGKGLVAAAPQSPILDASGEVVWDPIKYDYIQGDSPYSHWYYVRDTRL